MSAQHEIDLGDTQAKRGWESDWKRQQRQKDWAKREEERIAGARRNRWLMWVFRPVVVVGMIFGCLCATDFGGVTHLGLIHKREDAPPVILTDPAVSHQSPQPIAAPEQPQYHGSLPIQNGPMVTSDPIAIAAQDPSAAQESASPVINQRALERAQRHAQRLSDGMKSLTKERQEKYDYWDARDQYTYGTIVNQARTPRNADGLDQRILVFSREVDAMNQNPSDYQSLQALRQAQHDLGNLQIEYQNCLKELAHYTELIDSIDNRIAHCHADQEKSAQEIADIQAGNGPPIESEDTQPEHPKGIIKLAP